MNLDMNTVLFALYPYIPVAVCVVGCWIRFDREQYSWRVPLEMNESCSCGWSLHAQGSDSERVEV